MSKVEDVARALREAVRNGPEVSVPFEDMSFILARAAIEAMREPTPEMVAAFWRQKNTGSQEVGETGERRSDYDAWAAAIEAASS